MISDGMQGKVSEDQYPHGYDPILSQNQQYLAISAQHFSDNDNDTSKLDGIRPS